MQKAVLKIKEIGAPPEGFEDGKGVHADEILDLWEEYQDAVAAIQDPVTWEEAEILIKCCPTDHMAGIEWSILHCIESCTDNDDLLKNPEELKRYESLINECNSDMMREELLLRLKTFLAKHSLEDLN